MRTLSMPLAVLCFALLGAGTLAQEGVAKPDANKEDLKKLQGTWELASLETDGTLETVKGGGTVLVVKGQSVLISLSFWGTPMTGELRFTIDAIKKPKEIDAISKNEKAPEVARLIYRFEEDRLVICGSKTGVRPQTFDSKEGRTLVVFRRVK